MKKESLNQYVAIVDTETWLPKMRNEGNEHWDLLNTINSEVETCVNEEKSPPLAMTASELMVVQIFKILDNQKEKTKLTGRGIELNTHVVDEAGRVGNASSVEVAEESSLTRSQNKLHQKEHDVEDKCEDWIQSVSGVKE